ncbi:MAG: V-type ATPase 116kDa subunit family protein [Sulfolobales archaeon]
MLLPEKMARISLLVSKRDLDLAVYSLMETGSFQPVSRLGEGRASERARLMLPAIGEGISRLEQYMGLVGVRIGQLRLSQDMVLEGSEWFEISSKLLQSLREIDEKFEDLYRRARDLQEKISSLEPIAQVMSVLSDIDIDLERVVNGRVLRAYIFISQNERLERILSAIEKRVGSLIAISRPLDENSSVLLIITKRRDEEIKEIARQEKAREIEVPKGYPLNPKMLSEQLNRELEESRSELNRVRETASKIYEEISDKFLETYAGLVTAREALYLLARSRDKGRYALIEGYIPKSSIEDSLKIIRSRLGDRAIVEVKEIGRLERNLDEEPPSKYSVPKRLQTFKMISELYGPPSYREVVPIYITAITFPLIFGLMFPDLGHGLVLLIAGIIFYKILGRENRSYRELGELVIYVSLAAIIAGILSGEFFGPATPVSKYIEEHLYSGATPPLAVPIGKEEGGAVGEALMRLIFLSLRIGGATLVLSTLLGMVNSLLERDFEKMVARDIPRFLLFLSVAAPVFIYQSIELAGQTYGYLAFITPSPGGLAPDVIKGLLYLGLIWIFLGEVAVESMKHGISYGIKKLVDGFMEFFDTIIILIGNTISYLRIMGIALAHIAIIIAFYQPVKSMIDAGGIISLPAWILYAVGNLLDIGLESIVAFAHTLRLHLYEMFGKFYMGVGKPYEPLKPPMIKVEIKK